MKEDQHQQQVPAQALQQLQENLNQATEAIKPYAPPLSPEDRRDLLIPSMKQLTFIVKMYDYAVQNATMMPADISLPDFAIDKNDAVGLHTLLNTTRQLLRYLEDTQMSAASEAYRAALEIYQVFKAAAARNVPGAQAVYDELRQYFPNYRRKAQDEPTAQPAAQA